jgi:hypothetical protein
MVHSLRRTQLKIQRTAYKAPRSVAVLEASTAVASLDAARSRMATTNSNTGDRPSLGSIGVDSLQFMSMSGDETDCMAHGPSSS